jgi:hypothetical protein
MSIVKNTRTAIKLYFKILTPLAAKTLTSIWVILTAHWSFLFRSQIDV